MAGSPLQFAKEFARLHGQLAASPPGDSQLLLVLDFWQEMREHLSDSAFRSYFDEYLPLLIQLVEPANLADLNIAELMIVQSALAEIQDVPELVASLEIGSKLDLVIVALAKVYFYIGAVEEGLAVLSSLPSSLSSEALLDGLESTHEYVALQTICARATETNHPLAATLNDILNDWQGEREAVYHDRARCLFVERDGSGRFVRGRLRTLVGRVEMFGKSARTDEITFDNVIKTPDDPFVGVAYSALAAVRKVFRAAGLKGQGGSYYHAHFAIADSGQTFTGDSIGLAFGLLAHVQLLRPEVLRLDRLLSGEVAFTGGVDADGKLTAVNDETLGQKIERAFFSPVKYVVLPEASLPAAKQHLCRLRESYPRRNLILIAAERLADIIEDHNVVRSEKVCIGEFVAKKAAKYGRMTKVQVPLLVVLGYLLVCLLYPKAWVGFDWNPAQARFNVSEESVEVYNRDSVKLWTNNLSCQLSMDDPSLRTVADVDGDGMNEVLYIPPTQQSCRDRTTLFCYSHDGSEIFHRCCVIPYSLGGDSTGALFYAEHINVVEMAGRPVIITEVARTAPTWSHIRFWSSMGDSLGYCMNPGGTKFLLAKDLNGDGRKECFFLNYYNPVPCVSLLVLDPGSVQGEVPVFPSSFPSGKGNGQLACILFPVTDLGRKDIASGYSQPASFQENFTGQIDFYVNESGSVWNIQIIYSIGKDFRVVKVTPTEQFTIRRNELAVEGKLPLVDWDHYLASLRDSVYYLTDTGWICEGQEP
jgi:hypothetical protein